MEKRRRKRISPKLKAEIISASFKPGCSVAQVAQSYGVSKYTINNWRHAYRLKTKSSESDTSHSSDPVPNPELRFVELSVKDARQSVLEKASLIFSDFSISIEGRIKSSSICSIIKILEEV